MCEKSRNACARSVQKSFPVGDFVEQKVGNNRMSRQEKAWIKPGYLSQVFRADERRMEFDCKNQTIIQKECPVDIVFIGDSITQMWELEAYFHQYHLMILNRGIGGDRTKSFLHRFYADAIQLKPKMVMIMVGINDAWDLEFDPWKREPVRETEDVLQEALFNMEQVLKKSIHGRIPDGCMLYIADKYGLDES